MLKESAERGAFAQSMLSLERFSPPGVGWGFVAGMHGEECVEIREAACKVLVKIGAPAVSPLIDALQDQSIWMRMTVAWVLGELGDARAAEPLVTLLESKDALQGGDCLCDSPRQAVIEALVKIGTPAVEPFIAELEN
jgi:HEAT repeat protein